MKRACFGLVLVLALCGCANGQAKNVHYYVTAGTKVRAEQGNLVKATQSTAPDFTVDTASAAQTITGFGGSFNEQGWTALQSLSGKKRDEVIANIFSPAEANLSWGRIPIGASDYALERYTLAPVAGDFDMKAFTLDRDRKYLIPFIKAAKAVRPDLKLWASAWSPPVWMKDNNDYEAGNFIDKKEYYQAYALYLARFAEEYGKEGLEITGVAVQNEPTVVTGYPNGGWKPEQFRKFIRDYAGPLFAERKLATQIWLATFNDGNYDTFVKTVLDDPEARKYVAAIGLQWDGDKQIPSILENHPGIPIVQTETDCGNWHWKAGFNKDHAANDFVYAAYTWTRIKDYLSAGATSYMLWNIVLDQDGKNNDKKMAWPQNSGIVIDTKKGTVTYTPMFRAFEHFTRFVPVGSKAVKTSGSLANVISFVQPDGTVVVELLGRNAKPRTVVGVINGQAYSIELPAMSFATLTVARP